MGKLVLSTVRHSELTSSGGALQSKIFPASNPQLKYLVVVHNFFFLTPWVAYCDCSSIKVLKNKSVINSFYFVSFSFLSVFKLTNLPMMVIVVSKSINIDLKFIHLVNCLNTYYLHQCYYCLHISKSIEETIPLTITISVTIVCKKN